MTFLFLLAVLTVLIMPIIVAFRRRHQSRYAILIFMIFFGWTGVGWIIALIWSLSGTNIRNQNFNQNAVINHIHYQPPA